MRTISADLKELQDMIGKHGGRLERKSWYGSRLETDYGGKFRAVPQDSYGGFGMIKAVILRRMRNCFGACSYI